MERFFNTAGPVNCNDHYCLSPLARINLEEILLLIHQKKYFIMHAPRQTGKTSSLLAVMEYLNRTGTYRALYVNFEVGQTARGNVAEGMLSILQQMAFQAAYYLKDSFLEKIVNLQWIQNMSAHNALNSALSQWCAQLDQPLVLLIDEIDSLIGDTLISVLRQLRAGYTNRPKFFPQSVVLCGIRDVRDYRIYSEEKNEIITGGSCFNIQSESLRLGDFSFEDVRTLYQQHTDETGQIFEEQAIQRVWDYTEGQPWLVNALAYHACFRYPMGKDRSQTITAERMALAKEALILRHETHIDQLTDKLKEPRVRRVMEPILQGKTFGKDVQEDDLQYLIDLGLIRGSKSGPVVANDIYREVIPRVLTSLAQENLSSRIQPVWYQTPDGRIDSTKLMEAFQQFFRENSESWVERFDYKEAGPQLLLQAFLQRIVNGGGRVNREYGLGRGRTDLQMIWQYPTGVQQIVIECKLLHKSRQATITEGLEQTARYMDQCGATDGHLVIFDRSKKSWNQKIFHLRNEHAGYAVQVWGM